MAQAVDPSTTPSPKVKASALVGLLVSLLGAIVAAVVTFGLGITPESLNGLGLGVWAVPVATLVTTAASALAGYWKTDPLRVNLSLTGKGTGTADVVAVTGGTPTNLPLLPSERAAQADPGYTTKDQ